MKFTIEKSNNWYLIQKMAIDAGLEPGDCGTVRVSFVAKSDKKIIGGIMLLEVDGKFPIEWLSVLPEYRKKGVGSALVEKVIEHAKEEKIRVIFVSMQIPEFFERFDFEYTTSKVLPEAYVCFSCKRYNKSCFPVAMILNLRKKQYRIKIKETYDFPLLEKLAAQVGQETDRQMTKRIIRAYFAFKGKKVIGGGVVCKWNKDFVLDYLFSTQNKGKIEENILRYLIREAQLKGINRLYFIRGAPDFMAMVEKFNFKEIHFRDLPKKYRDFSLSMCDKCPIEKKSVCNPVAMQLDLGEIPKYVVGN